MTWCFSVFHSSVIQYHWVSGDSECGNSFQVSTSGVTTAEHCVTHTDLVQPFLRQPSHLYKLGTSTMRTRVCGPGEPLSCMSKTFPCFSAPDSNERVVNWLVQTWMGSWWWSIDLNQVRWSRETDETRRTAVWGSCLGCWGNGTASFRVLPKDTVAYGPGTDLAAVQLELTVTPELVDLH